MKVSAKKTKGSDRESLILDYGHSKFILKKSGLAKKFLPNKKHNDRYRILKEKCDIDEVVIE